MGNNEQAISTIAKVIANNKEKPKKDDTVYGEIKQVNDRKYMSIDGSGGSLTPVAEANDANDGDRVMANIKNRNVTVTGNLSFPASAKTATNYMIFDEEKGGLVVGRLKDGKPSGTYVLIKDDSYEIYESNQMVGRFSKSEITLGDKTSSVRVSDDFVIKRVDESSDEGGIIYSNSYGIIDYKEKCNLYFSSESIDNMPSNTISLNIGGTFGPNTKRFIINDFGGLTYQEKNQAASVLTGLNSVICKPFKIREPKVFSSTVLKYEMKLPEIVEYTPFSICYVMVIGDNWDAYCINSFRLNEGYVQIFLQNNYGADVTGPSGKPYVDVVVGYVLSKTNYFPPFS